VLDPEVDNGIFEVYWSADSFDDYWVTISINDRASMAGSIVLSQDLCGYDLACDYDGMQVCEYTLDAYMGCGIDLNEADRNLISIDPLLEFLPEYLYLNIEVCHTSGFPCEVSSREVTVY
jgi:alkylated DNA repair dioxygenase AlkB